MQEKTYIAIDLKSFYASVECRELGKDPLTTHLVVADPSRTEKTICLAVSPSLKPRGMFLSGNPPTRRNWKAIPLWNWIISLQRRACLIISNTAPVFTTSI